jgi:hypothetical protein
MASTYTPIATTTLTGGTSYTFSSIPSTYTDLILVVYAATTSGSSNLAFQCNGNTGNNYSFTRMYGNGSSTGSSRSGTLPDGYIGDISTNWGANIIHFQNYTDSNYKTAISRSKETSQTQEWISIFQNTSAINAIKIYGTGGQTFANGSQLTLYGILAA